MKLTPIEIKRQQFKKVMRGFDPVEVETFLGMIVSEFEELLKSNREFKDKQLELETQLRDYKAIEKTLQQTLAHAQETSEQSIANSRREAQLMISEAELKANQITEKARNNLIFMKEELTILSAKKAAIVSRLRTLLNSELQLIQALEVDEELQSKSNDEPSKQPAKDQMEIDEIVKNLNK